MKVRNLLSIWDMLPSYDDEAWDKVLNNIKCDIDYAKKELLSEITHIHNPGNVWAGETCVECGCNIRHEIHKREKR